MHAGDGCQSGVCRCSLFLPTTHYLPYCPSSSGNLETTSGFIAATDKKSLPPRRFLTWNIGRKSIAMASGWGWYGPMPPNPQQAQPQWIVQRPVQREENVSLLRRVARLAFGGTSNRTPLNATLPSNWTPGPRPHVQGQFLAMYYPGYGPTWATPSPLTTT